MPFVTASRREWLRWMGAGLVAQLPVLQGAEAGRTRWALLSDTHVPGDPRNEYRGFLPYANLQKVGADVAGFRPDGVIIDGDLARLEGLAADYQNLKQLLAPVTAAAPVAMALGNHDDRKNFRDAFGSSVHGSPQSVRDKHVVVIERAPVRLVVLDSLMMVNHVPGLLGKAQRTWLDEYLSGPSELPALLFVHHTLDDGDGSLLDSDRFLHIAARHRSVKAIFYGHSHEYKVDQFEGVHLVNLPAVGYNFRDTEPVGWVGAEFARAGCELTLKAIGGNRERHGKTVSLAWR